MRRLAARCCLKASELFARLAFRVSGEGPLKTATRPERTEERTDGEVLPLARLSETAMEMRADLHTPRRPAKPPKPLEGSIEERMPEKW